MKYTQLPSTYQDDTVAEAMYAREVEFFHYDFDRKNFECLLKTLPKGTYRTNVEERLAGTKVQMASVEAIYEALKEQITSPTRHAAAVKRTTAKRAAAAKKK